MKILITGVNGQVGRELARSLLPLGEVVMATRQRLDLANTKQLRQTIRDIVPDVIVNAAAYTAVDKAEQESDLAHRINALAPAAMAEEMKDRKGLLIHYSTDYVFDGAMDRAYSENDLPNPINVYGQSKLAGETALQQTGGDYLILRTSWVYAARGHNFLNTMLKLAAEREELKIVADQYGAPTWGRLIAETTAHILKQSWHEKKRGDFASEIYHLTASGTVSWHGFAEAIVELAKRDNRFAIKNKAILPIPASDYPVPAKRPQNSRLDIGKIEEKFALTMPDWRTCLALCLQDVAGN